MTAEFIVTIILLKAMLGNCNAQCLAVTFMSWDKMLHPLSLDKAPELVFHRFLSWTVNVLSS